MKRFENLRYLPFGAVMAYLESQILLYKKQSCLAPDEELETYCIEAWAEFVRFKNMVMNMYKDMQEEMV